jgi:biopolymer transport protein ExbD
MAIGRVPGSESEESGDGVFAEINITPLTDIFLVLLIIFMVTSTVIVRQAGEAGGKAGIKVNLPKGGAADVTQTRADLPVAVLADGRLVVGGDVVTKDELRAALERVHADDPDTLVIVQADEGVAHGTVVQVMELAKVVGLGQLAIGVRAEPQ